MTDDQIYKLLKLLVRILGMLPRPLTRFCSDILGLLWFDIDKRHRKVVLNNLTRIYGNKYSDLQIRQRAKRIFKNIAGIFFEVAWSANLTKEEMHNHISIVGLENVDRAQAKGRGVIGLTCHMGNFELLITASTKMGYPINCIYRKFDFYPLERLTREIRERFGTKMIPMRGASKKIEALLRKGEGIATLLDQNVDWYKGVWVDFFGKPACTNNGLAILALKNNTPVVPLFITRQKDKYTIRFLPEVPLVKTGDQIKDIEKNTQNFTKAIELMVRQNPEQYFWVHNRWKTKPYSLFPRQ
ncbi:MAG: lysophospholipid acyltransferase family protein [Desulfobacteraceae bacterium]|nr:lysophospholipid acyltransferase family protein [Desulfobacteraceae bacterium]